MRYIFFYLIDFFSIFVTQLLCLPLIKLENDRFQNSVCLGTGSRIVCTWLNPDSWGRIRIEGEQRWPGLL